MNGHQQYTNESFQKCASREIYEETGLKIKIDNNFKQIIVGNIIYYLVKIDDNLKKYVKIRDKDEVQKLKWIYFKNISNLKHVNWSLRKIGRFLKTI